MNIEKLKKYIKIINIIPNYKKVCLILDLTVSSGTSKTAQLKEMDRYFKHHKEGNKFIIDEIYESPLEKIENRGKSIGSKGNNNVYGKYIEQLVLDLLVRMYQTTKERKIYLSRDKMLRALNMVNDNYSFGKFNKNVLSSFINADSENVKEFYILNNRNLYESVERAFGSLANKCLVNWNLVTTVACGLTEFSERIILPDGTMASVFDLAETKEDMENIKLEIHTIATKEERDIILHAENTILEQMKLDGKKEAFLLDKYAEFNKKVCKLLNETTNIKYYYKSYDVIFHEKVVQELEKISQWILVQEEKNNIKVTLNGIISNNIVSNAEERQNKAINKDEKILGDSISNIYKCIKKERRSDNEYIEDNKKIVDTVINCKKGNLKDEMTRAYKEKDKESKINFDELFKSL